MASEGDHEHPTYDTEANLTHPLAELTSGIGEHDFARTPIVRIYNMDSSNLGDSSIS